MEYETLGLDEKLQIARDALRGAETDHFRVTLDPVSGGGSARLADLELRIERIRGEVAELETQVEAERE